jgi:GTPase SAR1 family protein
VKIYAPSLQGLSKSWAVEMKDEGVAERLALKSRTAARVGILGLQDVGKTWRLNRWVQKLFPTGLGWVTDGISIVVAEAWLNLNAIFSDIPGFKRVVPVNEAKDKRATDGFVQQVVVDTSDVVMLVSLRVWVCNKSKSPG